jgi:hypothetical protein
VHHDYYRARKTINYYRKREDCVFDRGLLHLNVMLLAVESLTAWAAPAMVIAV